MQLFPRSYFSPCIYLPWLGKAGAVGQVILAFLVTMTVLTVGTGCRKENGFTHHSGAPMTVASFTPASGGLLTEMLITGSNYSLDTAQITVTINGHKLKVVNANDRQIMAIVPPKCGSGHVIVKIGNDSIVSDSIFNYRYVRVVSTLAGSGTAGFANGRGTDAQFNFSGQNWYRSMGIAVDNNLNLYVADPGNHCIRKIDSLGNVSILAGNPQSGGYGDGQGTGASFSLPYDVAVDASGNVWSVDPGNYDIRKIAPDGTATTWAWGSQSPWSIAIEPGTGIPYYGSTSNPGNIYKVTAQWNSTVVIQGLSYPAGIRFDPSGNLYAVGNGDNVIHAFAAGSWTASIIAGSGSAGYKDGAAVNAQFASPWGLAIDGQGNLYVASNGTWDGNVNNPDQSIRFIRAGGWTVSTFAGSATAGYVDGIGTAAAFSAPTGVAVDKNGTVYVLDKNNNRIRKIVSQ